ncbi:MAG TPA: hypothetical protein VLY04_17770 [Bryobacteraceae bacterium]|nr:hypothetical protein [Bryobacteraceae bacterium]
MIEFAETAPDISVEPPEYQRLLGYPRDYVLSGRGRELADWARPWYGGHGNPWVYGRRAESLEIAGGEIRIDGASFHSKRLQNTLENAAASGVFLVAASAGPEAEQEAQRLWQEEKPDEYFFLEIFASAVVEHLFTMAGARLCAWADGHGMAVLPHYSPGYPEWDISEQRGLLRVLEESSGHALPGPLEALESGALKPKKSLLGVFGVTTHIDRVQRLTELVPCENCSLGGCQYRRTPYVRPRAQSAISEGNTVKRKALAYRAAEQHELRQENTDGNNE